MVYQLLGSIEYFAISTATLTLDIPSYLGSARKKDGKVVAASGRSPRT